MTKKHFEMVAAAIRPMAGSVEVRAVAENLAATFYNVNPRFDRRRFLIACGVWDEAQ